MSGISALEILQDSLENAYEIHSPWRASNFVIAADAIGKPDERVLVRERKSELEIGLCLAPELLRRLRSGEPMSGPDFTLALEGVSHFLCIVWNAGHARQVSPVELELQAEVDKLLGLMYFQGAAEESPERLHGWLFDGWRSADGLTPAERTRYATVNRLAAHYWLALLRKYPAGVRDPALGRELRRFYRLPREAKLRRAAERL